VLASVLQPVYLEVQTLSDTVRGKAGFGSTGV
jgi:dUTPase